MESTRFTSEDIEGLHHHHQLQERLPRVPQRRRHQRSSCCSNCNSQIVCSYLIALISSALVVGGVYLSLVQWNRIWLIISVSGMVLILFGSCLYYCGTQALINSNYSDDDEDSYDYEEEDNGDDETRHFPSHRQNQRRRGNNKKRRKRRGGHRPSAPEFVTRSLSQLSLNMIPQYFSPADTSFIRVPPGSNIVSGFHHSTSAIGNTNVGAGAPSVPVSQIFSVNGQSYLILPLNGDNQPPDQTLVQRTGPTYFLPSGQLNNVAVESTGIPLENLVNLKSLPKNSETTNQSEKGDITAYLAQLDPQSCHVLNNCDDGSSFRQNNINPLGTKINRKSLNRGRVAPGHHGSSAIQDMPLPPTPGSSSSSNGSAVPVSIIDHNPLARINSVKVNSSGGHPGNIPVRSSSLRSSSRPLLDRQKHNINSHGNDDGQPGQASTSNYFISFTSTKDDGKVSSGCTPMVPSPLAVIGTNQPSSNALPGVTGNHNHNLQQVPATAVHENCAKVHSYATASFAPLNSSFAAVSSAAEKKSNKQKRKKDANTTSFDGISSSALPSSSTAVPGAAVAAAMVQKGDTFSRKKNKKEERQDRDEDSQVSSSVNKGREKDGMKNIHNSVGVGSGGVNLSTTITSRGQNQQIAAASSSVVSSSGSGNNGYLPLEGRELDGDSLEGVITVSCHSNQRKNYYPTATDGSNGCQSSSNDHHHQDEDRERLIDLSSIDSSSLNLLVPSTQVSVNGVKRTNDKQSRHHDDGHHDQRFDYSSNHGPSCSSQVIEIIDASQREEEAEHRHAMFAAASAPHQGMNHYTDGDGYTGNIYEDTEDLILENMMVDNDDSQFSPPPSYAEVIQDTQGINYNTPVVYDSRNFPTFINPVKPCESSVDSKVSNRINNPATDNSGAIVHSTGTL